LRGISYQLLLKVVVEVVVGRAGGIEALPSVQQIDATSIVQYQPLGAA
jgi:hypothetical protein